MKIRQQRVNLLPLFFSLGIFKIKTGGSRPARRLTFVHAATKVSKNAFLLAEGIFVGVADGDFYELL